MIKFIHFRKQLPHDDLPEGVSVKGGKTIAFDADAPLTYAVAVCSDNDNFCRKTGRVLAEGRLKSARYQRSLDVYEDETIYEAYQRVEGI